MKRTLPGLASMLLSLASLSCADHEPPLLRKRTASVCRAGQSLVVSEQADGQLRLNFAALDSGALTKTLPVILGPRAEKTVMVHVDANRRGDLRWIVQAIERAGGVAYALDSACLQPRSGLASTRTDSPRFTY
jgi:biopolymer transport protein ExbD